MRPAHQSNQKALLRAKQQSLYKILPRSLCRAKSRQIKQYLLDQKVYKKAKNILFFCAFKSEPETRSIIRGALKSGRGVFLPRVVSPERMEIYKIKNLLNDTEKSSMGFRQPKRRVSRKAVFSKMDLVLVPGLAFDRKGRRLGRGKGYYDRLLSRASKPFRVGLVFSEGLLKRVPDDVRDQRMNMVVTDKGIFHVR